MLTAEQIHSNWETLLETIETNIAEPRKQKLLDFYKKFEDRLVMMPASLKPQYHGCYAGGYVDHVCRVVKASIKLYDVWVEMGVDSTTFTKEELVFAAINHDLGKFGTEDHAAYIEQTDQWRKEKLGELYMFNASIEFMTVPDRSLYLLQTNDISVTKNEFLAIKLHDGIYDESNKPYLTGYLPEQKPRTSIMYILHHADMMASRIEFETEWLPKFGKPKVIEESKYPKKTKKQLTDQVLGKTLGKASDVVNKFFN